MGNDVGARWLSAVGRSSVHRTFPPYCPSLRGDRLNLEDEGYSEEQQKVAMQTLRELSIATELGIPLAKECQELKEKLLNEQT